MKEDRKEVGRRGKQLGKNNEGKHSGTKSKTR